MIRDFGNRMGSRFGVPEGYQQPLPNSQNRYATGFTGENAGMRGQPPNIGSVLQAGFRAGNMEDGRIPGRGRFEPNLAPQDTYNGSRSGNAQMYNQNTVKQAPFQNMLTGLPSNEQPMSGGDAYWAKQQGSPEQLQMQHWENLLSQLQNNNLQNNNLNNGSGFLNGIGSGNFGQLNPMYNEYNQVLPQTQNPFFSPYSNTMQNPMFDALNNYGRGNLGGRY